MLANTKLSFSIQWKTRPSNRSKGKFKVILK